MRLASMLRGILRKIQRRWDQPDAGFRIIEEREVGAGGLCLIYRRRFENGWEEIEKRLLPKFQGRPEYEALQQREFDILRQLDHPLIVRALRTDSRPLALEEPSKVLILESIEARPLSQFIPFLDSLSAEARFLWCRQLMSQLVEVAHYLRSSGIIHGDLSPDNILIRPNGLMKVIDFATASSPQLGAQGFQVHGHSAFRAPEVRHSGSTSHSADIFAIGKIYEFILGGELSVRPDLVASLNGFLENRVLPESRSFEALSLLPNADFWKSPVRPRGQTKIIFAAWDPRAWSRNVGYAAVLISAGFLTSSFMPQRGYLSVNTLPVQASYSVDALGEHLWRDRPLRASEVSAGKIQISFRAPGLKGRVMSKTFVVQPAEHVKVFEDFRKIDTLSE